MRIAAALAGAATNKMEIFYIYIFFVTTFRVFVCLFACDGNGKEKKGEIETELQMKKGEFSLVSRKGTGRKQWKEIRLKRNTTARTSRERNNCLPADLSADSLACWTDREEGKEVDEEGMNSSSVQSLLSLPILPAFL